MGLSISVPPGPAAMESKTPITRLQEICAKKGVTPEYTLVHNGVGTHDPIFVYEVIVGGFDKKGSGRGRSKKEAKHAAAENLLTFIDNNVMKPEEIVHNPHNDSFSENSIGALQDFCLTYMISIPRYEQVGDGGLPHAKCFEMKCIVAKLSTTGVARTKKDSKKIAAYLMLTKLKELLNEGKLLEVDDESATLNESHKKQNKAVERLCEKLKRDVKIPEFKPEQISIDLHENIFQEDVFMDSIKFNEMKNQEEDFFDRHLSNPLKYLEDLLLEVELKYDIMDVKMKKGEPGSLICIQIKNLANATFFGYGTKLDDALLKASTSALKWLWLMAQ